MVAALAFLIGVAASAVWLMPPDLRDEPIIGTLCQWSQLSDNISHNRFPADIYYPVGMFSADKDGDTVVARSYSHRLAQMHEPSLASLNGSTVEAYRFLWLRSFPPAVAIRLWNCGNARCLSVKQIGKLVPSPDGGYMFDDTLTADETRVLSLDEWNTFRDLIQVAEFWQTPSQNDDPVPFDGAWWVMEGYRNREFNVVSRNSPIDGAYYEAGRYLIKISGIPVDEAKNELY